MYHVFRDIELTHWWFTGRRTIFKKVFKRFINENQFRSVLDVGCGTGGNISFLKQFTRIMGVDMDPFAAAKAKERGYHDVCIADAAKLPFPDASFDIVTGVDIIEHMKDDSAFLREMKRVLKPGGYLFLSTAAFQFLWSKHDELNQHTKRYRKSELKQLAERQGFSTCILRYYNVFLFLPIVTYRMIRKIFPQKNTDKADSLIELKIPSKPLNWLLRCILRSEAWMLRIPFPFGVSLFGLWKKS